MTNPYENLIKNLPLLFYAAPYAATCMAYIEIKEGQKRDGVTFGLCFPFAICTIIGCALHLIVLAVAGPASHSRAAYILPPAIWAWMLVPIAINVLKLIGSRNFNFDEDIYTGIQIASVLVIVLNILSPILYLFGYKLMNIDRWFLAGILLEMLGIKNILPEILATIAAIILSALSLSEITD